MSNEDNKEKYLTTIRNIADNLDELKNEFNIFKKVSNISKKYRIMKKYIIQ